MFYFLQAICLFAVVGNDGDVLNVLSPLTEWCDL